MKFLAHVHVTRRVTTLGFFNLDDFSAQVTQHHRAIGTGDAVGQVQNFDAVKRSASRSHSVSGSATLVDVTGRESHSGFAVAVALATLVFTPPANVYERLCRHSVEGLCLALRNDFAG